MADIYVSSLAGGGGAGTKVDPFTLLEAETYINLGSLANGETCWVKADGEYTTSGLVIKNGGATTDYKVLAGYGTTEGDNERASIKLVGGAYRTIDIPSVYYWTIRNFNLNNDSGGSEGIYINRYTTVINCVAENCVQSGFRGGNVNNYFINCTSRNNGYAGFYQDMAINCLAYGNAAAGFYNMNTINCIAATNGYEGFDVGNRHFCFSPVSHDNGHNGVRLEYSAFLIDGAISDSPTGYSGIYNYYTTSSFITNNNIYNCANGAFKPAGLENTYELDPQYNDASNNDFTRTGTNLSDKGIQDIGAYNGINYGKDIGVFQDLASDYPSASDVRNGTSYGSGAYTGTLDLPSENDVQDGVNYDNATKTGNFEAPAQSDTRSGTGYGSNGTEYTGTLDLPSENDVEDGVTYDNATKTGNFEAPAEGDVRAGTSYGSNGTEYTGTLSATSYSFPLDVTINIDSVVVNIEVD